MGVLVGTAVGTAVGVLVGTAVGTAVGVLVAGGGGGGGGGLSPTVVGRRDWSPLGPLLSPDPPQPAIVIRSRKDMPVTTSQRTCRKFFPVSIRIPR